MKPKAPKKTASKSAPSLSPRQVWLFRLLAVVIVPLLALTLLELALRLAGYGYNTALFEKSRFNGRDVLLNNENFSRRFFPPELARWPSPLMFDAVKPAGTYRVFIFGESAAQGDPEPAFGAARYLQYLLRDRYPGVNFEFVNVAITAIDSHVIVPMARECANYQGDLWIVYMGNNEMIGPFGAATVFGAKAPPWPLVRLDLAVQNTRVGQLLFDLTRRFSRRSSAPSAWGGLQMFLGNRLPPDDPRRGVVYKNFERNLHDILHAGCQSGADVLLSTVAVNMKDCPPFASLHSSAIDPAAREGCEHLCSVGHDAELRGDWKSAAGDFADACHQDPQWADAQFGLAQCESHLGDDADAAGHFQNACDCDALPFRADSRINNMIRSAGREMAAEGVALCDSAAALPQNGQALGDETFYEHVHFNFDGNYRLALFWASQIERLLPESIKQKAAAAHWASQQACEERLGLTDWNRRDVFNAVRDRMQRAPLNLQPNNDQRIAELTRRIEPMMHRGDPAAAERARAIYTDALRRSPGDYVLHENFGEFLELTGDIREAASEWKQARELMPRNPFAWLTEGELLEKQGAAAPARDAIQEAINIHPRYAEAWRELGKIDAYEGKLDDAMNKYQHAAALQPNDSQIYVYMGKALSLLKRPAESLQSFRHAVQLDDGSWEAHYDLGGELGMQGQIAEARDELLKASRLRPEFPAAHLNLGVALLKLNDPAGARQQFIETLRLDPANKAARAYLSAMTQSTRPR